MHWISPTIELVRGVDLGSILESMVSAQFIFLIAAAAWSTEPLLRRLLIYGGLMAAVSVVGLVSGIASDSAEMTTTRVAWSLSNFDHFGLVVPCVLLRLVCGWRIGPPETERRLSVTDFFVGIGLIAFALAMVKTGIELQTNVIAERARYWGYAASGGWQIAFSWCTTLIPVAWLVLTRRRTTATLGLIAFIPIAWTIGFLKYGLTYGFDEFWSLPLPWYFVVARGCVFVGVSVFTTALCFALVRREGGVIFFGR